ncbi:hypothetical protein Sya03_51540 [Spirilliplanes yamanashiensis]|uniref:Uncharacterized protein n=1 Tax=Spirilliplanes yamanashiensis TaxID=42233 RepID=A0A8J4DKY0_9ACTN|nr:hypothetical protein Sya03_51540 [Spirilliplanes yamanashiensis]
MTFDSRGVKRNTWTTPMNPAVLGGDAPPSWLPALLEGLSVRNNAAFESSPIEDDLRHLTPFENFPAHQIAYSMNNRVTADFVVSCQGGEVRGSILTWSGGGSGRMRCSDLPYDPGMAALAPFCADPVDTAAIAEPLLLDLRPPPSDSGGVLGPDDIGVN